MAQCERGRDRQHRQERCSLSKLVGALLKGLGLVAQQKFDRHFQFFHNELMARKQPYDLSYDRPRKSTCKLSMRSITSLIRGEIEEQLSFEPEGETRNRKPLRQPAPFEATWELRFGPGNCFRVLYGGDHERREVQIQAIGVKKGNRLLVGGEEIEL